MNSRRRFLQTTALGSTAVLLQNCFDLGDNAEGTVHSRSKPEPTVVATWNREKAVAEAYSVLKKPGAYALDAVEAGERWQESDPTDQSVGLGGLPDRDGHVTLDACIMNEHGGAGSVCFVQNFLHPISIARRVMEKTPHVMLVGAGAEQFAEAEGFEKANLLTEKSKADWEAWKVKSEYKPVVNIERHDTIGMLAIDAEGRLAGACTTSGLAFKMHGRVGDSPIIGAGMFCDGEIGAAVATGMGELMLKTLGSFLVVELMRGGMKPAAACRAAVERIAKKYDVKDMQVGYVAINRAGEVGAFGLRTGFNYTVARGGEVKVADAEFLVK